MSNLSLPIGVFDSGMGGLTVLKALRQVLPQESFLYLGDTARLPYGTKSIHTVQNYADQMVRTLINRGIKALVVACNTATTAALPNLKATFPDLPIIGVLDPGATEAVFHTKNHRIFILATETTIASNGYQKRILQKLPQAQLRAQAANVLVALAEEGMATNAVASEALKHYLTDFSQEDTILLGCTHFPVFMPILKQLLPHVALVNPAESTALCLKDTLSELHLLNTTVPPSVHYLVTDSIQRFQKVGEIFLGESLIDVPIELIDAGSGRR
ncbi:MAG: glutamate racemase [Gammaproteobacteria bacterium]|nr:glutamate racemase [Gammaproteobacteria bacterium]